MQCYKQELCIKGELIITLRQLKNDFGNVNHFYKCDLMLEILIITVSKFFSDYFFVLILPIILQVCWKYFSNNLNVIIHLDNPA